VENGQITAENYKNLLEEARKRDKKLLEFYEKKQAGEWAFFIRVRLGFLDAEIAELEQNFA